MCSENMTSLGRKEDLFYPKKEGGGNLSASALHKCVLAQSLLAAFTSSKVVDRQDFTHQF